MTAVPPVPRRVHRAEWARARFGADLADPLFAALERGDPIADALVEHLADQPEFDLAGAWAACRGGGGAALAEPVAALFAAVTPAPDWVDWAQIDRARGLFERAGLLGGLVLSLRSLMAGYLAPVGNKPLVLSGRLREQAQRRVAETTRFVTAVCAPGGMRPGAEGWRISLQVRLMHAQVRRLLLLGDRWDRAAWALPINQHDMVGTMLLFSEVYVEGLRILGFVVDEREAEDWIALWRLVAWVMGTEAALLPRDYAEAGRMRELIIATQGPADADSRALAAALIRPAIDPARHGRLTAAWLGSSARASTLSGLSRMLLGPFAEGLALPPAPVVEALLTAVPPTIGAVERARLRAPLLEDLLRRRGRRYWAWVTEASLAGRPARFARPQGLAGVPG